MPRHEGAHTSSVCDRGFIHAECCAVRSRNRTIMRIVCPLPDTDEHPDTMAPYTGPPLDEPVRQPRRDEVLLPCPHCNATGTIATVLREVPGSAPLTDAGIAFDRRLTEAVHRWVERHPLRSGERIEGLIEIHMHPAELGELMVVTDGVHHPPIDGVENEVGLIHEQWRGVRIVRNAAVEVGKPELRSAWRAAI